MRKLRKVVDLGGIDRVYAVALDRVTRSMRDATILIDEFEKAGVEVRFVHQPALTFGAQSRFLRHVLAAFAEFERDMIATRIAESRTYLKKHGRRLAGKVPYGYDSDPHTRQLVGRQRLSAFQTMNGLGVGLECFTIMASPFLFLTGLPTP